MGGREAAFDAALLALVLFLLVASPLALGAVHPQVVFVFEWTCLALVLLWIVRAVWVPPSRAQALEAPISGPASRGWRPALFGHPVLLTGIERPALLFAAVVALQLLPLPAAILRLVSPATAAVYETSLPGWGTPEGVDFGKTGSFLLGPGHDAVIQKIMGSPGALPVGFTTTSSSFRPLSIYPLATINRLLVFLALLGLFIVVVNTSRSRSRIDQVMRGIVLLGFALSVFGIVQRLSWNGKIYWMLDVDPGASPFGPFINHNHFAAFLAMIVPVAAGMLVDEARRIAPRPGSPGRASAFAVHGPEPFARLLLAAFVVGVMAGAIVLSASRGAVLALGASLLLYGGILAAQGRLGRTEALVALVLLVTAAGLSLWLGADPLARKLHAIGDVESEPSLFTRVVGWRSTLQIILSHPWLGTGLGTFTESWAHVYPPGTSSVWHEAHNDYLQLFSETGIAGFAIFLAAFGLFSWKYLFSGLRARGIHDAFAIHGAAVGILAVAVHSIVDFPLQINACAVLLVVMSGLLTAYRRRADEEAAG